MRVRCPVPPNSTRPQGGSRELETVMTRLAGLHGGEDFTGLRGCEDIALPRGSQNFAVYQELAAEMKTKADTIAHLGLAR